MTVSVTVLAASSALTFTPGVTATPSSAEPLAGSAMKPKVAATSEAVSGEPSAQVTPSFRVKVAEVGVVIQAVASPGASVPSDRRWRRGS
ncbi:hypothetical protein GCM10023075_36090 [Streptosporangium album]